MERWSLSAEFLALILVIMTALFYYDERQVRSLRRTLFETSMGMAAFSSILNVVCVYLLANYDRFPRGLTMALNSVYFLISVGMATAIAAYLFDLILEHVYSKICRTRAVAGLSILVTAYVALVISNVWNQWLFWIDSEGIYHRGIYNRAGYAVVLVEIAMVGMCYFRNRASVGRNVKRVIYTMPPIILLMVAFQMAFHQLLFNGIMAAFAILIIFVNFQNFRVGKDSLTGIGNRRSCYEEMFLRLRGSQRFQIAAVSLNSFNLINQKYGHARGDEFLYHIARWMEGLRPEGRVFRFGNVTFALVCPYVSEEESERLLDEMEARFQEPWCLGELRCEIPACFASMNCLRQGMEATQVVEIMTFLIGLAKRREDRRVCFNAEMEAAFNKDKELERLLHDSLEKNRFEVWYQPIYNCRANRFDTAEALLRLRDAGGRLISPLDFIPLAEKNGMIEELGWFVWETVCRFMGEHPELPLQNISVNMSAQQFRNPKLREQMKACLEKNGLSPARTRLEITERVLFSDEKYMKQLMREFASDGFMFSVDDFGVGYSNFSGVMHRPFEFVKFDKSLLDTIPGNSRDQLAVQSMMEMFHKLGLKVVAEGIETEEQQKEIRAMGADYIQGFYYAKPMPEAEAVGFLSNQPPEERA